MAATWMPSRVLVLLAVSALLASASARHGRDDRRRRAVPRPRIDPELDEYVLDSGDNLKLRCQSAFPVRWEIPAEAENDVVKKVLFEPMEDVQPYIIHLELANTNYMQTGYYRCVDNQTLDLEDGQRVTSIYVYVRDETELLALDPNPPPLTVNSGGKLVIPCRPTAPNVSVTLTKDAQEIVVGANNEVSFDPKIGFTYLKPHVIDSGEVTCTAQSGSHTSTSSFEVHIPTVSDDVATPSIHAPNHAIIGTSLVLNCSVPYENGISMALEWAVPDQSGKDSGRIVVGKLREVKEPLNGEQSLAVRTVEIKQVKKSDEGFYSCTVKDNANNQKVEKRYIPVLEQGSSYINLTVQGDKTNITANAGSDASVQWVVYHSAHPEPQLEWYDPEDKEITSSSSYGKFEVYRDSSTTRLVVKKPSIQDTGVYKLNAVNQGTRKTIELFLNVLGGPYLNVSIEPFYMVNTEAKITCTVLGNPLPIIQWAFRPCTFQPLEDCEVRDSDELDVDNFSEEAFGKVQLRSKLTMIAVQSGVIQSKACSSAGECVKEEKNFYVTDVPHGFHLEGPNLTVEGEKVEFNCSVSPYHYTRDIVWKFDGLTIGEDRDFHISTKSTVFSHRSTLTVKNVTNTNEGIYSCVALHVGSGLPSEHQISLNVTDVKVPVFGNKTNLMGNVKELAEGQSFTLYCFASGMPKPQIKWFKGKTPVKLKTNLEILDDGRKLDFKYLTLEDDGRYTCEATNRGGTVHRSITLSLLDKRKGVNVGLVVGLLILALLLLAVIIYLCVRVRREQKLRQRLTSAGLMHFEEGAIENLNMDIGVEDQAELLPYDRKYEFPRDKLKLGKTLGSGAFGIVVKADAYGIIENEAVTPVAVKMVKRSADSNIIKALASELKIMVHLGKHLNVVNLLGACTKGLNKMELLVIVEYCRYGNLHNYLMKHRNHFIDQIDPTTGLIDPTRVPEASANIPNGRNRLNYAALSFSNSGHSDSFKGERPTDSRADYRSQTDSSENFVTGATEATFVCMTPTGEEGFLMTNNSTQQPDWRSNYKGDYKGIVSPITTRDLLCYAFQVARGMEYLNSRKILHLDLAARNILLADNNIIKICDFGLAKSVYKDENYLKKENGPLPIKWMAIESIRDRTFSTQSDVWSFGIVLWEFFSLAKTPYTGMPADEHMYKKLEEGYRMEKPPYATDDIYAVMMDCWQARPVLRPSFTELVDTLGSMLEDGVRKHYVDLNEPYVQMNHRWLNESGHNDYLGMFSSPTYTNVMSPLPVEDDEPQRYQNIPRGAPTVVADHSLPGAYLNMTSPFSTELDTIFSPTRPGSNGGNVFKFQTPPQGRRLRDTEVNDDVELRPMLSGSNRSRKSESTSGHESDDASSQYTAVPSSRPVMPNVDSRSSPQKSTNQGKVPSFSNPSYSFAPDLDNYVNYKQRNLKPPEPISNMSPPTFSTFGRRAPVQERQLPPNYVNIPQQRAPLALSETDFNDPPYVN
ncbi:vascular endothelial growth factor receptor 1 isoform X2 [Thrips palmi]|uniref:receptor protein-tyrosine kinase n=1 Tax=Thrips palmi TaxID=161013 RepID=A0A6P8ZXR4_THRPL|nr:vascular endothelial growth factor receptor 1 isoform X2 [Thrips palmi]